MSAAMEQYFQQLNREVQRGYDVAAAARSKGLDPETTVPIPLAQNMAERVVGLISVVAPQIVNTTITQRIVELEQKYGLLDWRVGFAIAEEVARGDICPCDTKEGSMELGIRVGFAYLTLGIVSAPLEGFIGLVIKKRQDGKEYFALQYAGPIRGAGGTAASTSVLLADYVRVKMGYSPYDPTEAEVNRYVIEVQDYHERVTNLQYLPSEEELRFLVSHLPVEVDGDPTEKFEVSNYKDLPRIPTNLIRGGVALVLAEGLSQKAPKLWKRLSKWGQEFELSHWSFLAEFIKLKEEIHSAQTGKQISESEKRTVKPNNTFIMDLVAGRPILTHPMAVGGFRLRYGRTRVSGFSACGLHPATLRVLNNYIAIGTQLKVERPGKAASVTVCETIDGPIVRLHNGSVLQLKTEEEAKSLVSEIEEIIFLGDILFNYGDFSENGQRLVPVGYCPEWWGAEVQKAVESNSSFSPLDCAIESSRWSELIQNPLQNVPTWEEALAISKLLSVPLHPEYIVYWKLISGEELMQLSLWLTEGKLKRNDGSITKLILPYYNSSALHQSGKEILHKLGLSHAVINKENIVLERKEAMIIDYHLGWGEETKKLSLETVQGKDGLTLINSWSEVQVRDKAGTFIGARMGRPEKAKMRQMTGSPQVMFPVGEEGDRLRSFQSALEAGKINSTFPTYHCLACQKDMVYPQCEECHQQCSQHYFCRACGDLSKDTCRHGKALPYKNMDLDISYYFTKATERLGENIFPDLIKGIRGTSNKNHVVEHLAKGFLRAKHNIYVNKDGTTRYDCTELPLTHFKPKEIKTAVSKLQALGYTHDILGEVLSDDNQLLELKPQDIILPGFDSLDESAPQVLKRVAQFVDNLLANFYGLKPFYNISKEEDLVGHLVIGLAPHISAGLIGRIIGFSETQGLITHPMYHAGLRRDCFSRDTYIPLCIGGLWHIQKIGDVVERLHPTKVIDDFGTTEVKVKLTQVVGAHLDPANVNNFTKHMPQPMIQIKTKLGRTLKVTANHKQVIFEKGRQKKVRACQITSGDRLAIPYNLNIPKRNIKEINLFEELATQDWVMVKGVNSVCKEVKVYARKYFSKRNFNNYFRRDSYPIDFVTKLRKEGHLKSIAGIFLSAKRDTVKLPATIPVSKEFLQLVGLYIAEGYSRQVPRKLYQVYIAAENKEIRRFVQKNMKTIFGLKISERKTDRLTYSSRILYHLFTTVLQCGSSAYEKRVPSIFLNLPNFQLGYLLSGYLEGDGSVSTGNLRVTFDTVSQGLLHDLDFLFGQMGIFVKNYVYTSQPGPKVREFYILKNRKIPFFTGTKGIIQSVFMGRFIRYVDFISSRKKKILSRFRSKKPAAIKVQYTDTLVYDTVTSVESLPAEESYCLNVEGNLLIANSLLTAQCDGDEAAVLLLLDALLNFSRQYLPEKRGAKTMDSPLVLTAILNPNEVDDQVHGMDVAWKYPLELYEAANEMNYPWEVKAGVEKKKVEQIADRLGTPLQFEQFGYTHSIDNFNKGVRCSAYKTQPSMEEKLMGQMDIAKKVRAVNMDDVAKLVIQKHFLRDIKGNLRKFSMQQFRCVKCNDKFRRPPLCGKCTTCGGKLIFTITEGSVVKYLHPSLMLASKYDFSPYLKQVLDIVRVNVDHIFGKEKEKQTGLGAFVS